MNRNRLLCTALAAFILLSAVGLHRPHKKPRGPKASELTQQKEQRGQQTWISYVDQNGQVTQPADRDYAIWVSTRDKEDRQILEQYLDAQGNPAVLPSRFSSIAYQHEENAVRITYLDPAGMPVITTSGYAVLCRTKTPDGKALLDTYFDTQGNPARCTGGYHGYERTYGDQGWVTEVTYLDEALRPTNGICGYCREVRTFDEHGRISQVRYFDSTGKPSPISAGQYGEGYLRDESGRITHITFLDAEGQPAPNNAGYTTLQHIYTPEGVLYEDRYLDAQGQPTALSKGQYGTRYVDGLAMQLGKRGHLMLSVDNLLYGFPYMVVVVGAALCIAMILLPPKPRAALLAAYVLFIFYETLMFRESGDPQTALIPFTYLKQFWKVYDTRSEVLNNIWLFVPLGAGLYSFHSHRKILWIPFALTVSIEVTQYVTGLGLAEMDDIIGNTFGSLLGFLMAAQLRLHIPRIARQQ